MKLLPAKFDGGHRSVVPAPRDELRVCDVGPIIYHGGIKSQMSFARWTSERYDDVFCRSRRLLSPRQPELRQMVALADAMTRHAEQS